MRRRIWNIWLALVACLAISTTQSVSVADEIPGNDIPVIQYHIDTGLVLLDPDGLPLTDVLLDFRDGITNSFFDNSPDNPLFAEHGGLIPNWESGDSGESIYGVSGIAEGFTGPMLPWAQISSGLDYEDFLGVRCYWVGGSVWDVVETNVTVVPEPATVLLLGLRRPGFAKETQSIEKIIN